MKQIIRSNAVETPSQRGILEIKLSNLHSRQASIQESPVLSPAVTLSVLTKSSDIAIKNTDNRSTSFQTEVLSALLYLVWWSKLDFLPTVVVWVCTGKILQVSHTQVKQITSGIFQTSSKTQTLGVIIARAEPAPPRALALKVYLLKLLPNVQKKTQLVAKIAQPKTWLNSIYTQQKQQSHFRNSFLYWELQKPLLS
ncbi:hypothetical protein VB713_25445 [Anabaena cylindrica UHCC 0172]|uniref:hypothetical protein n=1 Tax=Anabaena cylindrica TaxID=1165 RepID=UPI002B1FF751|nr:hypothetical protein [Anabaena cylindrica]MEA5554284.1 hypothetical protein [Anabaena cylindrica UHCC 0172]